ncbi:ABC transporter permease [Sphaerimonospora sp. CA-214678]|uniref:ABC transporter permease n=1 Tax=Sphaerimonospora sp. CA-214678 TaxID=3240029 RepID=UPI003D8EA20C
MIKLVKAELQKLFTTRLWWILLLVMLLLVGVFLVIFIVVAGIENNGASFPGRDTPEWAQMVWASGVQMGWIMVMVLGVVMMTSEYRYQTITGTLLTTPRRGQVVAGKLITGLVVGALFALALLVFQAIVVIPTVLISGGGLDLSASHIPQISVGIVVSMALYALFGIGLGALVRNQVAGIVIAVVWTYIVEPILSGIPVLQVVGKWLPGGAAQSLMSIDVDTGFGRPDLLPAWGGALILVAYGLLFAAVASATTLRRDIT